LKWINGEANTESWQPSETDPNAGTGKYGSCCTEIDIWEANKISTAFTMHACDTQEQTRCSGTDCGDNGPDRFKGLCDKNGCDMQSYRLGTKDFWGPGGNFKVDSTKPVTVTTQFITEDGSDNGKLTEVKQFYTQNGQTIEHQMYTVNGNKHDTITDEFCADWVAETQDGTNFLDKGGMTAMGDAMEKGVVLVMSMWDDHYANMLWLDSTYPVDSTDPGAARGTCSTSSGVPADVESAQGSTAKVKFSDIRFGPIGSTTDGPSPSFSCDECVAHGFKEDQCGCGYCSSFGSCGFTCGKDPSQAPLGPQCEKTIKCSECEANGYGADQCGCGYCGSFGGCGWTCGHDASQLPKGPKCTVGSVEV
jgi:cellulose 1,4-beta-cellobiosidase